jgi:hypothetical protein
MSLDKVAMGAGHKVLIEVEDNISLIAGDPQGFLNQQPRPRPIHLLNITSIGLN